MGIRTSGSGQGVLLSPVDSGVQNRLRSEYEAFRRLYIGE